MQIPQPVLRLAAQIERGSIMVRVLTSVALVLCATASLAAQAAPARAQAADAKAITITGCLSGGAPGFVISNVLAARAPGEKGARTSVDNDLLESYALVPRDGVTLAPHVGHRVEIVGSVVEDAKKGEEAGTARGRIPRGPTAQFAVTSVKMISPVCIQ